MAIYDDTHYYLEQQHNYCAIICFVVAEERIAALFFFWHATQRQSQKTKQWGYISEERRGNVWIHDD